MTKFKFDPSAFLTGHMQAPRGRGSWAFSLEERPDDVVFSPSMTYSEARKWAVEHFSKVVPADWTETVYVNVLP